MNCDLCEAPIYSFQWLVTKREALAEVTCKSCGAVYIASDMLKKQILTWWQTNYTDSKKSDGSSP